MRNIVYASKEISQEEIHSTDDFSNFTGLDFLGVLPLEENSGEISQAILSFKANGIKVWIFSADDDVSIVKRCGMQSNGDRLFYLTNLSSKSDVLFRLSKYKKGMLVVDKQTLNLIL